MRSEVAGRAMSHHYYSVVRARSIAFGSGDQRELKRKVWQDNGLWRFLLILKQRIAPSFTESPLGAIAKRA